MNIWRISGTVLLIGLSLFLLSLLLKLLLIAGATVLLVRIVGGQLAGRFGNRMGRMGTNPTSLISIDHPTYHPFANQANFDRVVPIG